MRRITILLLILAVAIAVSAQKKQEAQADTVKVHFLNGIAVHGELVGLIQKQFSDHGQYEVGVRVNILDKYFPAVEVGIGEADEKDDQRDDSWCKVRAPYMRVGCDFNVLRNKHDRYKVFGGARYALSHFDYDLPTATETATYHWLEGVFGVDAEVWGPLHLGWDVRYRRHLFHSHGESGAPWYIPGFGDKKNAGFTLLFNVTFAL